MTEIAADKLEKDEQEKLEKEPKSAGFRLVGRIVEDPKEVIIDPWISEAGKKSFFARPIDLEKSAKRGTGSGSNIGYGLYEPRLTAVEGQIVGKNPNTKLPDRKIVLGHELIHAEHSLRGTNILGEDPTKYQVLGHPNTFSRAPEEEQQTVGLGAPKDEKNITENDLRKQHGIPLRISYNYDDYEVVVDEEKAGAKFQEKVAETNKLFQEQQANQKGAAGSAAAPVTASNNDKTDFKSNSTDTDSKQKT